MKTILCVLLTLPWVAASAAPDSRVDSIQTIQGRTYRQCKILKRDADGIAFSHQKGTARVLFSDLPMSTRHELGYDARAAADLEATRKRQREERLEAQHQQQKRLAEQQAARQEQLRQYYLWQQQAAMLGGYGYGYPGPAPFAGPVPAVGFAAPGWGWPGHAPFHPSRHRGWEGLGIASIVPGTGGVYMPQSGGHVFTGYPQVHYSPTLGYYNPGYHAPSSRRSLGTFGFTPGLAAPRPPAVVPGVRNRGSAAVPAKR